MPTPHGVSLDQVVKAAEKMLPDKKAADQLLREIERQEKREIDQAESSTNGETEPEE